MRCATFIVFMVTVFGTFLPRNCYAEERTSATKSEISDPDSWMVVVGDSGVTGAASEVHIAPNMWSLGWRALRLLMSPEMAPLPPPPLSDFPDPGRFRMASVEPMTRVIFSRDEHDRAVRAGELVALNLRARGFLGVDVQEHSSGYMIGRALGIQARDIVLVGQDGARVSSIPDQFARIFEMSTKTLPPLILVSFTANDFCDLSVFTDPVMERRARFQAALEKAWRSAKPRLVAHPKGTRVLVLEPLDVTLALTNPLMLSQKVSFQGMGEISCADLRERVDLNGPLSSEAARRLGKMCPSVLMTRSSETGKIRRLAEIQREFSDVWKSQIASLNLEYRGRGIEWEFLEGVRSIPPERGDLANDCFHPSVRAHAKVADHVLKTAFDR